MNKVIQADEPITRAEDDLLGRAQLAKVIADEIRRLDPSSGSVVGILGPWGSGKTSLINLVSNELSAAPPITVISFNPWMFSGTDQLVDRFFAELGAQLRSGPGKLPELANALQDYGEIVSPLQMIPVIGSWIGLFSGASKGLKELREKRRGGINRQREQVSNQLKELKTPIVVVIDDIDRLRSDEIRDIFRLIRLTGNFPSIIYMVAFDRERVEKALSEEGVSGRDYLEKIVQVNWDIPQIPEGVLTREITASIDRVLNGIGNAGHFDRSRWEDNFFEVIRPLFSNMRDIRRYSNSIGGTVRSLEGRIELVDVLALEAIRVFLPDVFTSLGVMRTTLTEPPGPFDTPNRAAARRTSIELMLETAGKDVECAKGMIRRLFPAASAYIDELPYGRDYMNQWLSERRVAHLNHLNFYLERVVSPELDAVTLSELAFDLLSARDSLESFFRSIDPALWEDTIRGLEVYEDDFSPEAAGPATVVLLNLMPNLPDRPRGFFDFGSDIVVTRVVLRLFRKVPNAERVEEVARDALPQITTLFGKLTLLNLLGHEENAGHRLLSEESSLELEAAFREEVRRATPAQLAREPQLIRTLSWTKLRSDENEPTLQIPPDPAVACSLLRSAVTAARIQPMDSRAIRVEKRLHWNWLANTLGGEQVIRQLVDHCQEDTADAATTEALELAGKYLSGWRPERI